jgi:hypothetical protein
LTVNIYPSNCNEAAIISGAVTPPLIGHLGRMVLVKPFSKEAFTKKERAGITDRLF